MKNTVEVSSKSLIIVGNNFISNSLYNNYRRSGRLKVSLVIDISLIKNHPNYIIDCSFDKLKQDQSIIYCKLNNIEKILLLNHWERTDLPKTDLIIIQSIVYDVYGNDHMSFNRPGSGNYFENSINYCWLISESIRRIYEARVYNKLLVYIPYDENKIKYIHVDNLFDPINYMITTFKNSCIYSIYDDEKSVSSILYTIKNILDYNGTVVELNDNNIYTKYVKSLDFNFKKNYLDYEIKKIYNYLIMNNERFQVHK